MKKLLCFAFITLFSSLSAFAQTEGINFQGVARNAAGEVLVSQQISLRLSVLLGSESGAVAYVETRLATSNPQGIFSLVVGDGNAISKTGNFSSIDWKTASKFLKVEMDPNAGNNFLMMGISRMQAVPFAFYAYGVDAENVKGILPLGSGGTGVASISELKKSLAVDQINNTSDASKPISTATQAALTSKANASDVTTSLATKVDKVTGKELSTNDYTTAEKTKLAAITGTNTGDQDLSGYATTTQLATKANASDVTTSLATKVDKVTGKELSTNDYTTTEKTKLAAITGTNTGDQDLSGYATTTQLATKANAADVTTSLATKVDKVTGKELSTNDYTTAEKTKLAAITGTNTGDQDLSGFATTTQLATKANSSDVTTGLATKVDKVTGKELSTNDYTTAEKTKLAAITGTNTGDQVNITGNAGTATKLQSSVTINGIAFDGSANITVPGGVPYTGATQAVDLGAYELKTSLLNGITVGRGGGNIEGNTAIGSSALSTNTIGTNNTAIGNSANVGSANLTNATAIGNGAIVSASNTIQLGNTAVTNVNTSGAITAGGKIIAGASSASSTSAVMEANSTTQGFLPPRLTTTQRDAITSPVAGLTIWNTTNTQLEVYDGSYWKNMVGLLVSPLNVGDPYGGGKVFYIFGPSDNGFIKGQTHGLIAATEDQTTDAGVKWFPEKFYGATGTYIGLGLPNTLGIIASAVITGTTNMSSFAAGLANSYRGGGYIDWYLPSRDELNLLYQARDAIGGFATTGIPGYWSSTQKGGISFTDFTNFAKGVENARIQFFYTGGSPVQNAGTISDTGIGNVRRVRAIRMF